MRVGLHIGVTASYARNLIGADKFPKNFVARRRDGTAPVKIDQVFCASLNMHAGGVNSMTKHDALSKMRFLLQGAYEGTYSAAVLRKSPELYLTCVGGGVFFNPLEDVACAIANAHYKYLEANLKGRCTGHLKKVVLPLFMPGCDFSIFVDAFARVGLPEPKVVRVRR